MNQELMKTETLNRQFLLPFIISLFILSVLLYLGFHIPHPDFPEPTWIRKAAYVLTLLNIPLIINLAFKALSLFKKPNLTMIAVFGLPLLLSLYLGILPNITYIDYPSHFLRMVLLSISGLVLPSLVLGGVFLVKQHYDLSKSYPFLNLRLPLIPFIVTVTPHLLFLVLVLMGAGKGLPFELEGTTLGTLLEHLFYIYNLLLVLGVTITPVFLLATINSRETLLRGFVSGVVALVLGLFFTPILGPYGFRAYHQIISYFNQALLQIGVMLWYPFLESLVEGRFKLLRDPWRIVGCQVIVAMAMAAIFIATPVRLPVGVNSLVIDPSNPQVVYVGILKKDIYKTNDGGESWKPTDFEDPEIYKEVRSLAIYPINPQILYAGTCRGLYKTIDGGESWTKVKELDNYWMKVKGLDNYKDYYYLIRSVAVDPHNSQNVYISAEVGLLKSTDGGSSWKEILPDYAPSIAIDPINPEIVYVGTSGGVFKTTDRGESWVKLSKGFLEKYTANSLAIDPKDTRIIYAGVGREILKSSDAGESWMEVFGPEIDPFTFIPNIPIVINPGILLKNVAFISSRT
ncbi:MAG: Xyloglucanase Xgh74A [candidate division WS2 bacterium]|nr:Xyloglucanase Xgh74A [Candidatus Psychracetigena formicireducens]